MVDTKAFSMCGQYQLDVDINSIVFWHHHLFSQEHVLSSQLARLYEDYVSRLRKRAVEFLTAKVATLILIFVFIPLCPLARSLSQTATNHFFQFGCGFVTCLHVSMHVCMLHALHVRACMRVSKLKDFLRS